MTSSSSEEITDLLVPLMTAAARGGQARMLPVVLTTTLVLPTFTGQDARESVVDCVDELRTFTTVCGFSDLGVLQRVPACGRAWYRRALVPLPASLPVLGQLCGSVPSGIPPCRL
ncbi:hypothetical protein MTO96_027379 [Rhipicephalus appendiculatus]